MIVALHADIRIEGVNLSRFAHLNVIVAMKAPVYTTRSNSGMFVPPNVDMISFPKQVGKFMYDVLVIVHAVSQLVYLSIPQTLLPTC